MPRFSKPFLWHGKEDATCPIFSFPVFPPEEYQKQQSSENSPHNNVEVLSKVHAI